MALKASEAAGESGICLYLPDFVRASSCDRMYTAPSRISVGESWTASFLRSPVLAINCQPFARSLETAYRLLSWVVVYQIGSRLTTGLGLVTSLTGLESSHRQAMARLNMALRTLSSFLTVARAAFFNLSDFHDSI